MKKIEYIKQAYHIASYSPDPSNQNGALVVNDGRLLGWGCNSFHYKLVKKYGLDWLLKTRERKLSYIEHAERNAVYEASKHNDINDSMLFCPWIACSDCAKAIALSGIKTVIAHKQRMDLTPHRWRDSISTGIDILKTIGVKVKFLDKSIKLERPVIINGKKITKI